MTLSQCITFPTTISKCIDIFAFYFLAFLSFRFVSVDYSVLLIFRYSIHYLFQLEHSISAKWKNSNLVEDVLNKINTLVVN